MYLIIYGFLVYFFTLIVPSFSSDKDNFVTLKSGSTLVIPKGFYAEREKNGESLKIEDPEKSFRVFFIEREGKDLSEAINQAWQQIDSNFHNTISNKTKLLAPTGYDEYLLQTYETDQEDVLVQGKAQRKDEKIWVLLIAGPQANILKRELQLDSLFSSLKIPGLIDDDLSQSYPKSITYNINQLNTFIINGMKELGVPGLSIAIVENNKIIFEQGYGIAKLGEEELVTSHTLMKIGSITKPMTTLLVAKLIEEGKFSWHTKACELYSKFKVGDDKLSKTLEMQQLMSGSTGLPREDFSFSFNYHHLDPFQGLALIKATTKNKEIFQYNNQLFVAAGEIAAHIVEPAKPLDQAFRTLIKEKLFKPMGMKETTFKPKKNYAFPHNRSIKGDILPLTLQEDEFTEFLNPAGGIWSNAHDMALYIITELKKGVNANGVRVFDEYNLMYRRKPQIKVLENIVDYGLGWFLINHKGLTQVSHGGSTNGFASSLKFFPEKQCGFIILANSITAASLNDAISDKILELCFESKEKSSEKLLFSIKQLRQQTIGFEKWIEPLPEQITFLLGKHENKQLGIFEIKEKDGIYFLETDA